jgi:tRNA-2-methylthio-N6-dimethylallyladenosine synthase
VKIERLNELIALQNELSAASNARDVGQVVRRFVRRLFQRSREDFSGRTQQNKMVVFPKGQTVSATPSVIRITGHTSATLLGELV